jgi:hypothetical protein
MSWTIRPLPFSGCVPSSEKSRIRNAIFWELWLAGKPTLWPKPAALNSKATAMALSALAAHWDKVGQHIILRIIHPRHQRIVENHRMPVAGLGVTFFPLQIIFLCVLCALKRWKVFQNKRRPNRSARI